MATLVRTVHIDEVMSLMLLPQTAEYALRVMACLAALPPGSGMRARDLAEAANIPTAYVSKVLRRLVLEGLLLSQKGHHGGFSLARPPERITFIDVLNAADFDPLIDRCAFGWGHCDGKNPCPLHHKYSQLKEEFYSWARRATLADVDLDRMRQILADPSVDRTCT